MDSGKEPAASDAVGQVRLDVKNSMGATFDFTHSSRSVIGSAVVVVLKAVEYFVNSELAFIRTWKGLQDAKARARTDQVETYTRHLAELVRNTSYSAVIEEIRGSLDDAE